MSWQQELRSKIESIVLNYINPQTLELIEINLHKTKSATVIQILVDRVNGGITIDECAEINVHVNNQLDSLNIVDGDYTVEVSSPGLDLPLKTAQDFKRVVGGNTVRFHLSEMIEKKLEWAGVVKNVEDDTVVVQSKNLEIKIPISIINKAFQIIN